MNAGIEEDVNSRPQIPVACERRLMPSLAVLAIALSLLRYRVHILLAPLPLNDFMVYWGGAKLLLTHANPYSVQAITNLERSLGWTLQPHVLLNPPWSFPLFAWIGLFSFDVVHPVCRLLAIIVECVSALLLWRYFGGARRLSWIAIAIVATFLPAGSAEQMGQITVLMVAAAAAWLWFTRRGMYFPAGLTLFVFAAKPHLLALFLVAIVLWCVQQRHWSMLAGAVLAVGVSAAAVAAFNPQVLTYLHGSTGPAIETECGVGGVLREIFGMQYRWLQFVPTAAGLAWLAVHWRRYRHDWRWEEQAPLLVVASLALAPYNWAHDFVLALPAVIALAVRLYSRTSEWLLTAAMYLGVQIIIFSYMQDVPKPLQSLGCVLWLVLYVFVTQRVSVATTADLVAEPA